jgi:molybdopterin-guanine dinucleotide biosynthesis protein MobB
VTSPANASLPPWPPVIAVSGFSGSGKTLLLERLLPRLCARGLRLAVIKDSGHAVEVDRPGKDSDRLFRAGADVLLNATNEVLVRLHQAELPLAQCLSALPGGYDLVLVEGFRDQPVPQIRVGKSSGGNTLLALNDASAGVESAEETVVAFLSRAHAALPVFIYAPESGEVWATARDRLALWAQFPSAAGGAAQVAAVVAAMRWQPAARWVIAASGETVEFPLVQRLLAQGGPGRDAVVTRGSLPLLLEPPAQAGLEAAAAAGCASWECALQGARVSYAEGGGPGDLV